MDEINSSLKKITKASLIVLVGTGINLVLSFFLKIIVARNVNQDIYGMYVLLLAILEIVVMISLLGLSLGVPRFIAYFREKKQLDLVKKISFLSLKLSGGVSLLFVFLFLAGAKWISITFFHEIRLITPLKIFSFAIPLLVTINIFSAIFQGFNRVEPRVYFQNIIRPLLIFLLVGGLVLLNYPLSYIVSGHLLALALTVVIFFFYVYKNFKSLIEEEQKIKSEGKNLFRQLILFSLPLLITSILGIIMVRTDTLMIGYFRSPQEIGLYNGAVPLARLLQIILGSVGFIYLPIISGLWAKKALTKIKRVYQVITKWVFAVIFPIVLLFVLFPQQCLRLFFGPDFIPASQALQLLALGWLFHVAMGTNGLTLMGAGKTKIIMWGNILAVILNIFLNVLLIPKWGITGAALAFLVGIVTSNIFISFKLYQLFKIHPFTKNYLKPLIASLIMIGIVYITKDGLGNFDWKILPFAFIFFILIYLISLTATKSIDKEDIMIIDVIERRSGLPLTFLRIFFKKLV